MIDVPNSFYRVSIKGLILDETEGKFLIVLEDNGRWELPGGGKEWGESAEDCLKREIQEEMGLAVTEIASRPSYCLFGKNSKDNFAMSIVYKIKVEHLNFTKSNECEEIRFVSPAEAAQMKAFYGVSELAKQFSSERHA